MLEQIDKKVDTAQDHLDNVNLKLKNALEKVRALFTVDAD
jgi:hypothetical protein